MTEESDSGVTHEIRLAKKNGRSIVIGEVDWLVYELGPTFDRRRGASLVFESVEAVRVVRDYPPDWRELTDSDLFGLSMRT